MTTKNALFLRCLYKKIPHYDSNRYCLFYTTIRITRMYYLFIFFLIPLKVQRSKATNRKFYSDDLWAKSPPATWGRRSIRRGLPLCDPTLFLNWTGGCRPPVTPRKFLIVFHTCFSNATPAIFDCPMERYGLYWGVKFFLIKIILIYHII